MYNNWKDEVLETFSESLSVLGFTPEGKEVLIKVVTEAMDAAYEYGKNEINEEEARTTGPELPTG